MTTQAWSTVVNHSTTAGFRAWGLELNTKLAAAGLVQTADTGQINWATVNRPAVNSLGGYEIWKLNDSLFGTVPVFFRIEYRTATSANDPQIKITVGNATNGAGVLSGANLTNSNFINPDAAPTSLVTGYQSYCCVKEGFFGLVWKIGSNVCAQFFFCRTASLATGTPNGTAGFVLWGQNLGGAPIMQVLNFAAATNSPEVITVQQQVCLVPLAITSSSVGANIQAFAWFVPIPQCVPLFGLATVIGTELSGGTTFTVTMVGTAARTFISLGPVMIAESSGTYITYYPAMLWE